MAINTWRIGATSYYADWVTVPILGFGALASNFFLHGLTWPAPLALLLGALFMSFVEYGVHRWAFHNPKLYRREHFVHHARPADYVGIPGWHTGAYFSLALATLILVVGLDYAAWTFAGIGAAYLAYIVSHDRYHHGSLGSKLGGYWHRQARRHNVHHAKGVETNFGVSSPLWDHILGTYTPAE